MTTKAQPAMKLVTGAAAIATAIESIANRGKKLDRDIHIAAVSCIKHHADHGDITLMNRLIAAMPKGSRVNALRDWVQVFSGMTYDEGSKAFVHEKDKPVDLDGAIATTWTDFAQEKAYVPFDAQKAIAQLVNKLKSADAKKGDKVTPEQAAAITAMAKALGIDA